MFNFTAIVLATVMYGAAQNPEDQAQKIPCPTVDQAKVIIADTRSHSGHDLAVAHECLGIRLIGQKSYALAIQSLLNATSSSMDDSEVYNYIGVAYNLSGDYKSAIDYLSKAIFGNVYDVIAYEQRGWAYVQVQRYEAAEQDYARAIVMKRNPADLVRLGVVFYQENKYDNALLAYNAALKMNPSFVQALQNRAILYGQIGNAEIALADWDKAIALQPNSARLYAGRARLYMKMGNTSAGQNDVSQAVSLGDTGLKASDLHHFDPSSLGAIEKPINFNPADQDDPDSLSYQLQLARASGREGKLVEAMLAADRAVEIAPGSAAALNERAWIYHLQGKDAEGLTDADGSLKLRPQSSAALETRAEIYEKLGRTNDALLGYEAALAINPSDEAATRGLKRLKAGS